MHKSHIYGSVHFVQRCDLLSFVCVVKFVSCLETQVTSQVSYPNVNVITAQSELECNFNFWKKKTCFEKNHSYSLSSSAWVQVVWLESTTLNLQPHFTTSFSLWISLHHHLGILTLWLFLWLVHFQPSHDDCVTWKNQGDTVKTLRWAKLKLNLP